MRYERSSFRGHHTILRFKLKREYLKYYSFQSYAHALSCNYIMTVMKSKYSKFGVETFNTFWVIGYNEVFFLHDNNDDDLATTIARLFLRNKWASYDIDNSKYNDDDDDDDDKVDDELLWSLDLSLTHQCPRLI